MKRIIFSTVTLAFLLNSCCKGAYEIEGCDDKIINFKYKFNGNLRTDY